MDFSIHAKGAGKRIRVHDRIAGQDVINEFLSPDERRTVSVASNDGQVGDVDVVAQMRADSPWTFVQEDYAVRAGEPVDVDDV